MTETTDEKFLRESIQLARVALEKGNAAFGALLVVDGEVVLRAENTTATDQDVTAHAELNLVRMLRGRFPDEVLRAATLYASTEPCPMCAGAIFWAGIGRVVFGCSVERLGELEPFDRLDMPMRTVLAAGHHPVAVVGPLLEDEAAAIHGPRYE